MSSKVLTSCAVVLLAAVGWWLWAEHRVESRSGSGPTEDPSAELVDPQAADPHAETAPTPMRAAADLALRNERAVAGAVSRADRDRDVHGRVLGVDERPVPGALVQVLRDRFRDACGFDLRSANRFRVDHETLAEARTDPLGEFAIEAPLGRPLDLVVEAAGYARYVLPQRYAGEFVEVRLRTALAVQGRVVRGSDASPVPGAQVFAWREDHGRLPVGNWRSDAAGEFRMDDLSDLPFTLLVVPPGGLASTSCSIDPVHEREVEVAVSDGFLVRGVVRDEVRGVPLAGASLGQGWMRLKEVQSDSEGRFEIDGYASAGRPLQVSCAGYGSETLMLHPEDGVAEVEIELAPARELRGVVVDADGRPLSGVYVAAYGPEIESRPVASHDCATATTDARGAFVLGDLRADLLHTLYLSKEGHATVLHDLPERARDHPVFDLGVLRLGPAASLRGTVVDGAGELIANCDVTVHGTTAEQAKLAEGRSNAGSGSSIRREGRSDDLGRFSFADLGAGSYSVRAIPPDVEVLARASVDLTAGEQRSGLELVVDFGRRLAGRVVDEAGEPLPDVWVTAISEAPTPEGHQTLTTDAEGRFRFVGLALGTYRLLVRRFDGGGSEPLEPRRYRGVRVDGGELEVVLRAAATITGTVLDEHGEPVPGLWVFAFDDEGRLRDEATSDERGGFQLRPARGGEVELRMLQPPPGVELWQRDADAHGAARSLRRVSAGTEDVVLRWTRE